jgi:hypothetical protein
VAAPCRAVHRAACLSGTTWTLTPTAVPFAAAASACAARGAVFAVPRAGDQNERMHALAADVGGAWVRHRIT